ncbi:alpha/beta fold hydrolase [Sediminibacterium sp.]|uniref:alpha/beta fold hydrolase n=1 Tax=Sediminibacterium sp. TaxID=1917865 RepID=UPI003F706A81
MKNRTFIIKIVCLFLLNIISKQIFCQVPKLKEITYEEIKANGQAVKIVHGFIDVPENREKPNDRIIRLPVAILKSPLKDVGEPIFYFEGGPGGSNMLDLKSLGLVTNHDIICVGYRGVDGTVKLQSKKVGKATKGLNNKLLSDKSLDNLEKAIKEFAASIKEKGIDISKYTMLDVIEDMEYTRKALGYVKVNLFSVSYGTRVALIYSYKYPEVIKRSVMVGANPPGHFVWFPEKTEQILDKYDSIYKATNIFNYKGSIKAAINQAFDKMPKRWRVFKLDADKIKTSTFQMMLSKEGAVEAFDAYYNAANNKDYSGLYMIQTLFDKGITKNMAWGDYFQKAASADYNPTVNYRDWLRSTRTTLGPTSSLQGWGTIKAWHSYSIPEEYQKVQKSNTETLIISGNLDISTPSDFATEKLLPAMPNGKQVILKDYSHNLLSGKQNGTVFGLIFNFYDTGKVDETGLLYDPIDFSEVRSLSTKAKKKYFSLLLNKIF